MKNNPHTEIHSMANAAISQINDALRQRLPVDTKRREAQRIADGADSRITTCYQRWDHHNRTRKDGRKASPIDEAMIVEEFRSARRRVRRAALG